MFDLFSIEQLSTLTGYSLVYLEDIRRGRQVARPRFRELCARFLGLPEDKLFGADPAPAA